MVMVTKFELKYVLKFIRFRNPIYLHALFLSTFVPVQIISHKFNVLFINNEA